MKLMGLRSRVVGDALALSTLGGGAGRRNENVGMNKCQRALKNKRAAVIAMALLMCHLSTYATGEVDDLTVIDTIPVGIQPVYMALTPDGNRLYVVNQGVNIEGSVSVVDTATNELVDTIPLGVGFPFEIAMTPDGSACYLVVSKASGQIVSTGSNRVEVIDTASNTLSATIPITGTPFGPIGVAVTPDGNFVYVTHRADSRVDVISTASNLVVASVSLAPAGEEPVGIAITPDGNRAYVANRLNSTVSVIDTATNQVVATVPVSVGPSSSTTAVTITPDGAHVYVTASGSNTVTVIDTDLASEVASIATSGVDLAEMVVTSDGLLMFVVSSGTGDALIINIDPNSRCLNAEVGAVAAGTLPFDIVLQDLPVAVAYMASFANDTVSVIGPCSISAANPAVAPEPVETNIDGDVPAISHIVDVGADDVTDTCCRWDCAVGDSNVGILDFLALLAQWGQVCAPCDFNGNGVGIDDFLDLLAKWGPCP